MWKKVSLGILIALFFLGSIAMIGWIGFQERLRLALQSFEQEEKKQEADLPQVTNQESADYSRIETKREAEEVVKRLEGFTRTLEEDNLPSE